MACLYDSYRLITTAVREYEIGTLFRVLRRFNIEPILIKGWSIARLYEHSAVRCPGDIDVLVQDEQLAFAEQAVCADDDCCKLNIDWHSLSSLGPLFAKPEEAVRRSRLFPLADTQIRVLCHEDNLHLAGIHMLKHAGWDPRWVKDVCVLLESRPAEFDWDVCLGPDPTRASWVLTALVVAQELNGVDIRGTPAEKYGIRDWIIPAIWKGRKDPRPSHLQPPESIWAALKQPWRIPDAIRKRWPNPITAAITIGAPFEDRSPFTHQMRYCARLAKDFFKRMLPAGDSIE